MAGISSKAAGELQNKEKTFQGQRFDDDLGLNWIQFKWRNHDPQIGRFIEIDPLSEKYVYNSTYAFSENHVTVHVELEGLEKVSANPIEDDKPNKGGVQGSKIPLIGAVNPGAKAPINSNGKTGTTHSQATTKKVEILVVNSKARGIGDVGHTAIQVGDKVYGYYPTDQNNNRQFDKTELLNSKGYMEISSRSAFEANYTSDGIKVYTLDVTQGQATKIENSLTSKVAQPGNYSLFGNQCTSVAIQALNDGGIIVRTNQLVNNGRDQLTPRLATPKQLAAALEMGENRNTVISKYSYSNSDN